MRIFLVANKKQLNEYQLLTLFTREVPESDKLSRISFTRSSKDQVANLFSIWTMNA